MDFTGLMKRIILALVLCCAVTVVTAKTLADKPDLFLLKTYNNNQNVVGWVMSEKFDGVRGFWDGRQLLTRGGKALNPPAWFVANYPPFAIDGELWTKRADFENIVSIVRRKKADNRWKNISHQIFEVPNQTGGLFNRLAVLKKYLAAHPNSAIKIIKQIPIKKQTQLAVYLAKITAKGGEGVVVRNPDTPYQVGRLSSAFKLKKYLDSECLVQKILIGKGRNADRMGSILCQTKEGKNIKIGSGFSDKMRENPPLVGSEITFKYYGLTRKGKPRFPVFLRIRPAKQK